MPIRLIVHGGAWNIPAHLHANHISGVHTVIEQVYPKLVQGISALDAVEQAVNILEADDTYDAGRGAFLNELGEIELDAMIMDGQKLDFGAVSALQNILHPVSVARKVMEKTEHCYLTGQGAQKFAQQTGFQTLDPKELLTARELEFYHKIKDEPSFRTHHPFEFRPSDTVGAVAMDAHGNLAAATSTGGTARKMQGRVGDSPIAGAGGYADNQSGAVSATGWGESIMRVLLSKTVCDAFLQHSANEAAQLGIDILQQRVQGMGGVIGINKAGDYAFAYNTPFMAYAYQAAHGEIVTNI